MMHPLRSMLFMAFVGVSVLASEYEELVPGLTEIAMKLQGDFNKGWSKADKATLHRVIVARGVPDNVTAEALVTNQTMFNVYLTLLERALEKTGVDPRIQKLILTVERSGPQMLKMTKAGNVTDEMRAQFAVVFLPAVHIFERLEKEMRDDILHKVPALKSILADNEVRHSLRRLAGSEEAAETATTAQAPTDEHEAVAFDRHMILNPVQPLVRTRFMSQPMNMDLLLRQTSSTAQSGTRKPEVVGRVEEDVKDKVDTTVKDKVEEDVKDKVDTTVKDKVEEPAKDKVDEPVKDKVEEPVKDKVEEPVKDKVEEPVKDKVEEPVKDKVEEPVKDKVEEATKDQVEPRPDQPQSRKLSVEEAEPNQSEGHLSVKKEHVEPHGHAHLADAERTAHSEVVGLAKEESMNVIAEKKEEPVQ